ncbi:hypothetical protein, partial [Actinomyces sp. MRS3W]|uniref:hypothetical protein n=1 Tax=Actinomyces sp. MRS3W TaxID=2800796 RepID=UPI0028FDC364
GLGTATVNLEDSEWFFHNAYAGLRQEGGWLFLFVFLGVFVWFGLRPQRRELKDLSELILEAAVIVELVCAWKLGEVFLSTQTYPLLAAVLLTYLRNQPDTLVLTAEEEALRRYRRA